jgi:hypothetical protein
MIDVNILHDVEMLLSIMPRHRHVRLLFSVLSHAS